MDNVILKMQNITKDFPGVRALDDVTFQVKQGEIHCLVGENGAGKSTLMKILSGVYSHREYIGEIVLNGKTQTFGNISDSEKVGIAIIYQELALIPELTVYENIFIGHEVSNGLTIDWLETINRAGKILKKVRLDVNPDAKTKDLGVGEQQLVEIGKALSRDVKLLILDEPTSALNEDDVDNLFDLLRDLKNQGVTSVLITHKLREVIEIADTVTVLRDGKTVCTLDAHSEEIKENILIRHMVGREIEDIYPKRKHVISDEIVLEVKNWKAYDSKGGKQVVKKADFNIRKGEIVGFSGLMGSGRTELALSIFGNPEGYQIDGDLFVNGQKKIFTHPQQAIDAGIAYVTEDRKTNGLILIQDVKNNVTLANLHSIANKLGVINSNEEIKIANDYKDSLDIKTPSIEQKVEFLSGGNQQKVSLSKWLYVNPDILILDEPTRGIDVGAKYEIYTIMNRLVKEGMSILMISSELPEILGMSDRIYVVSSGEVVGELSIDEANQENIMELATRN